MYDLYIIIQHYDIIHNVRDFSLEFPQRIQNIVDGEKKS